MTSAGSRKLRIALFLIVWVAAVALLMARLHYGFLPEDDPALSYLGERTLQGGLPNVDFYDNYTGGLSFLSALAIRLFGARLISGRIVLLLFFIPWVLAVWYLASRITSWINALLLTLLAAVWSVPVYPAPFASWYNLYFATFGTAALFRYIDTGRRRWIFWAGVCGGLSLVAKIFGLYFVAAVCLFLLFDEQNLSVDGEHKYDWSVYSVFLTLGILGFVAALVHLINSAGQTDGIAALLGRYYNFVLPIVAVCGFLICREWTIARRPTGERFQTLSARAALFCLGLLLPIAMFLVPYVARHAVGQLLAAVLLSRERVQHTANIPASNLLILLTAPLLLLLLVNAECKDPRYRRIATAILSVMLAALLIAGSGHSLALALDWFSIAEFLPLLVVIAVFALMRRGLEQNEPRQRLVLLALVAAISGLVQFPVSAPTYFCFVASLVFLLLVAVAEHTKPDAESILPVLPVMLFYLLFGITAVYPAWFYVSRFDRTMESRFTLPRAAGFVGDRNMVHLYEKVVEEVNRHAGNAPIYAGPDSPGLYFLTGHQNPTHIYMDFLAGDDAQPQRILQAIDDSGVQVAVINHGGSSDDPATYNPSGLPSPVLLDGLRQRFPEASVIGFYEIRWK
jgi:hypothetical protein